MKVQCLALACFAAGAQAFGGNLGGRRNNRTKTFQMVYHINTTITPNRCGQVQLNTRYDDTSIRMTRDYPIHKGTCADQGFTVNATPSFLMSPRYPVIGSVKIFLFNKPNQGKAKVTIVGAAVATPTLSTLVAAVKAASLVTTLNSRGNARYTVFAPTNAAFKKLGAIVGTLLKPANKASLIKLLKYHVVSGSVLSTALHNRQHVKTLEGQQLIVGRNGTTVTVSNGSPKDVAQVISANIACSNGVVHVINTVLIPPHFVIPHTTSQNGMVNKSVVSVVQQLAPTLASAIKAAGLARPLSGRGPFTVFAPTNAAFAALQKTGQLGKILANKALLRSILEYHVVPGQTLAAQLKQGMKLRTLDKPQFLTVEIEKTKGVQAVYLDEIVKVTSPNHMASNGVVHLVNEVLVPPNVQLPAAN